MSGDGTRDRARRLAAEAVASGDATGWFERLYQEAERGEAVVPWADGAPARELVEWAERRRLRGEGRAALVVGCGPGDDAEHLAGLGFDVTAFDVSPTAIAGARRRFAGSAVRYEVADLVNPPEEWSGAFALVVEISTIQPLFGEARERAIAELSRFVAPEGWLLLIARATDEAAPERDPERLPWALTRTEVEAVAGDALRTVEVERFLDGRTPPRLRWRALFRRE